jgi:hypothetical protein
MSLSDRKRNWNDRRVEHRALCGVQFPIERVVVGHPAAQRLLVEAAPMVFSASNDMIDAALRRISDGIFREQRHDGPFLHGRGLCTVPAGF